jgi:hypothetical protein
MKLPDATMKHLGQTLRAQIDSTAPKKLPAHFLFLLEEVDAGRNEERAALHRVWARRARG